jgi:hypothetical protein
VNKVIGQANVTWVAFSDMDVGQIGVMKDGTPVIRTYYAQDPHNKTRGLWAKLTDGTTWSGQQNHAVRVLKPGESITLEAE